MADKIDKVITRGPGYRVIGNRFRTAQVRVALTAAQIIALHSVPVALVAAPGAGAALIFDWMTFQFAYGTVQFTGGGVVSPVYHGLNVDETVVGGITANTIKAAASSLTLLNAEPAAGGLALTANLGLDLYAATADFAAGDSTAIVVLSYGILTLG